MDTMAKRKSVTAPVVISKKELLLPRMEFLPLGDKGFYVRELGGRSLLAYKEIIRQVEKEVKQANPEAEEAEPSDLQSLDLMVELVYRTACNADGTPYFSSKDEADLFADASLSQLQLAADKAQEMAGMGVHKNLKNDPNSSSMES